MDGSKGKQYLKNYIERVRPHLDGFFDAQISETSAEDFGAITLDLLKSFHDMVSLGKGIRGALTELAYKACGGIETEKILHASSFIELFHSAILIHDDFMDRDNIRRGAETIHTHFEKRAASYGIKNSFDHYGNSVAVCIGDSGLFYSWKVLMDSGFAPELLVKAGSIYSYYIGRLGLGQAMDMTITGIDAASEAEALKVLQLKSAEYTSVLPMLIGATLAGETDVTKLEAIKKYALCFGWAFQIQDDILGLFSNEEELGKPIGSDLREGKNTLLMINLRRLGTSEQKEFQKSILGNPNVTKEDTEKMKQILIDSGTLDHVLSMGANYVSDGIKEISKITDNKEYQEILESLIVYMAERTK